MLCSCVGVQVATTCVSFPLHDVNNFLLGSEEGGVYMGCRHGSKAGVIDAYDGQQLVSALSAHFLFNFSMRCNLDLVCSKQKWDLGVGVRYMFSE